MNVFAVWQTVEPVLTSREVMMWLGILGGVMALVKFGAFLGGMGKTMEKLVEEMKGVTRAIETLTTTFAAHARDFAVVTQQVREHDTRLQRIEGVLGG